MITDSHCHLGSHRFSPEEIPDLIARAKENGVHRMITLATGEDDLTLTLPCPIPSLSKPLTSVFQLMANKHLSFFLL